MQNNDKEKFTAVQLQQQFELETSDEQTQQFLSWKERTSVDQRFAYFTQHK